MHGQEVENESEDPMIQERSAELNLETKQIFIVDYCKRGTTKCRRCKKNIAVNELRIGKSIKFNSKNIYQYFHVACAFKSFEKAKSAANTITCMDDIMGFDLIRDDERMMILQLIDNVNKKRKKSDTDRAKKFPKPTVTLGECGKTRVARLKSTVIPSLEVMYTNADQLTASKITELRKLVKRKKTLVIAVQEAKPKNNCQRSVID